MKDELFIDKCDSDNIYLPVSDGRIWKLIPTKRYRLCADKIQTIDDIKHVLGKLVITFIGEENIKGIEHLVEEEEQE